MNYTKHITLNTDRLQLREMNLSDMDALSLILQDEKVMYAYNGAFNDEETIAWMQKQLRRYKEYGFGLWGVVNKKSGEMIGNAALPCRNTKGYKFLKSATYLHISIGITVMLLKLQLLAANMDLMNYTLTLYIPLYEIQTLHLKKLQSVLA